MVEVRESSLDPSLQPISKASQASRLTSIDTLRGFVMVLMALDHTRDFWGMTAFNLVDPNETTFPWFATRWITHFCAPVFVLLAGMSAHLYGSKCGTISQLSRYLVVRGIWLVLLEVSVVEFCWRFRVGGYVYLQVIAVLGWSLILLAGLVWLPRWVIAIFALALIAGHNLFDGIHADAFGLFDWVWYFLHESGYKQATEQLGIVFAYPLVPWCGVMALGYVMGPWMVADKLLRRRWLVGTGIAAICLFLVLRFPNIYGDPNDWSAHPNGFLYSCMSFLNVNKYPPSLLYLCVTLGPSLLLLCWMECWNGAIGSVLRVFGCVPLFFYLIHLPIIRLSGTIKNQLLYGANVDPFGGSEWPDAYEPKLWLVYVAYAALLFLLYPLCKWYRGYKKKHRDVWLLRFL